ncbi:Maf family protein [Thiocystis violacea]|uniref:Maf family protein n=1 Tax=Thiocystis violacea TaxID=13725 RepID=UPI0019088A65|nr:Maf family protein [Thiocystis violacea]MBK1723796.1 septum formation inhibitor Maf [Thiocystis violacea]
MTPTPLVLASTSVYRRALLERLGLTFATASPDVDERRRPNEPAQVLVLRLAEAKARAVAQTHPHALIIGSDQVACLDDAILGKPGNRETAIEQLERASGRTVVFQTGLCLLDARSGQAQTLVEPFRVHFRTLSEAQIHGYVDREQPYDCAGSFKSEGLGIALFERLEGDDPNALIGLPLIRLIALLEAAGIDPLGA